mgnify:CR=1 FL=1|jgi:Predicted hydrolase (HAD superfamily)
MIRGIIFDLDNCLAAADEPGEALYAAAFAAMRRESGGRLTERELAAAFADVWRHPLDWVAERHGFSREMREAGWKEFQKTEVTTSMRGYGDLEKLGELAVRKFLVTSGFRRLQESKIRALGLERWMEECHVDAIDEAERRFKRGWFEDITGRHALKPEDVAVVGDSPASELAVGRELGMRTIQILRPGVERSENVDAHVRTLGELRGVLGL